MISTRPTTSFALGGLFALGCAATSCGSSDTPPIADLPLDDDAGVNGDGSEPGNDDTGAAAEQCTVDGTACGDKGGLCKGGSCQPCADTADDSACTAAYPNQQICKAGACTAGNCHESASCSRKICNANTCTACTSDAECKADAKFGARTVCQTTGISQGTCVPISCDAVAAPWRYHVDPVNGTDAAISTGSGTSGQVALDGCSFKTLTRAMQAMLAASSNVPVAGTQLIVDVSGPLAPEEAFPDVSGFMVPANVTILGAVSGVVVRPPANSAAFTLAATASALQNLTVDGMGGSATGVIVGGPAAISATLTNVEVTGFTTVGIRTQGQATLTITGGTNVHAIGTAVALGTGLTVGDTAVAIVTGGTPQSPTQFSSNTLRGIQVTGNGSVRITGAISNGAAGAVGTVATRGNNEAGIYIQQQVVTVSPAVGACGLGCTPPPQSVLNGLLTRDNGTHGLHLMGGSNVQVRNTYASGNLANGVFVSSTVGFAEGNSGNDFARIDLGIVGDFGRNRFQDSAALNRFQGICFDPRSAMPLPRLNAIGNIFGLPGGGQRDCTVSGNVLQPNPNDMCDGSGVERGLSLTSATYGDRLQVWNISLCGVAP